MIYKIYWLTVLFAFICIYLSIWCFYCIEIIVKPLIYQLFGRLILRLRFLTSSAVYWFFWVYDTDAAVNWKPVFHWYVVTYIDFERDFVYHYTGRHNVVPAAPLYFRAIKADFMLKTSNIH